MPQQPQVRIARTQAELITAVREADEAGVPVTLTSTTPQPPSAGRVVQVATTGFRVNEDGCEADDLVWCGGVLVTVQAGHRWDDLVGTAVAREWVGVEALSGAPGSVAGAVVSNLAAHGQAVADTLASVRTWDRRARAQRTFAYADCGFGPGQSVFSRERQPDGTGRYVLLDVAFLWRQGDLTRPLQDADLAALVGAAVGDRVPLERVRRAVLGDPVSTTAPLGDQRR